MQKYVFETLVDLLDEIKQYKKYANLERIRTIISNEIPTVPCVSVTVNDSPTASSFYGIIVFPHICTDKIESFVIEIQKQAIDLFTPTELAALLIHDISHNVLHTTVVERYKMAMMKAARMTNISISDIVYNSIQRFRNLAYVDISNRTYKEKIFPGTDMYEPDRLLVDMDKHECFNDAIDKMATIDYLNLSSPDDMDIADTYIGLKVVKMIREKLRSVSKTYTELCNYIQSQYDTKVLSILPSLEIEVPTLTSPYQSELMDSETLKPYETRILEEGVRHAIEAKYQKTDSARLVMESAFGDGRITYSALQKELDIVNFKIESLGSTYEKLAILDRIYDNIFALEKFLAKNPGNTMVWDYLKKFVNVTETLKDTKIQKRKYGVFVEVPPGYEG